MNWVDYVIAGFIVLSAVVGFTRGLIKEVFSLINFAIAFWVAGNYYSLLSPALTQIQDKVIRDGAAMALVFVITMIIGGVINHIIGLLVSKTGLSGTNMLLGVIFGGARGLAIVAAVVYMLGEFTPLSETNEWAKSQLIPHLKGVIEWFFVNLEPKLQLFTQDALKNIKALG